MIQEIQRYKDQPSAVAEQLIDQAAFGDHPLGRTVLGPEEHLRTFTRDAIVAFRERRWAGARGAAFVVGNLEHLPTTARSASCSSASRRCPTPEAFEPAPAFDPSALVEERDTNQSHLRMIYAPADRPGRPAPARGADDLLDAAGRLDGLAPVRRDPRAARPLLLGLRRSTTCFADVPVLQLGSGLESAKCVEAYTRMREIVAELHADGPTEEEVERARAYAAGRRVLAFENTNAVARYAAGQAIVYGEDIDPDGAIAALDAVTFDEVARDRRRGRPRASSRSPASARTQRTSSRPGAILRGVAATTEGLNDRELDRYVRRVGDRWPLQRALPRRRARGGPAAAPAISASAARSSSSCS